MKLANKAQNTLAEKIEANREKIIEAVEAQYKKSWNSIQQMRCYVYIDSATGEPSTYEHYGSEILPENVWNGTDPLIAEYIADGISPEEAENDEQCLQTVIECYMNDEQREKFEKWKASEEYLEITDGMDYIEVEVCQSEWIEEHTDAYERYCDDIIDKHWEEDELPNVEKELDELINELKCENENSKSTFLKRVNENKEKILNEMEKAYRSAWECNTVRYVVYIDGESGEPYTFTDVAGGNSEPEAVWAGHDWFICEHCNQHCAPEDLDGDFKENLETFLSDEEKTAYEQAFKNYEDKYGEETADRIKWIKENTKAYEAYCDYNISELTSDYRNNLAEGQFEMFVAAVGDCLEEETAEEDEMEM